MMQPTRASFPKYTQSSYNSITKKKKISWAEELNRHYSKEDVQMTKHLKRCSTLLIIEKCKSKLQQGITSHWSEWSSLKGLPVSNAGEGVEKRTASYTVDRNVN